MKIVDVMIQTADVVRVSPDTSYADTAKLLHGKRLGAVPVCDEAGKLVGIISEKDLFRALFPNYGDYYETPESVSDEDKFENAVNELRHRPTSVYMTKEPLTAHSNEPLMKAGGLMLAHHIHHLPIVDDGKLVGIISREDVFGAILKMHLGF